ncbi:MAG: class I SAM-dependent methyltransferase [Acidimicrobiales bacterium]
MRWFEVDHPDTQADKVARLDRLGIARDHIAFVAADFTTDRVDAALLDAGLGAALPSLVLLEGVVVYLDRDVTVRLLTQLAAVGAQGSRLAVSLSVTSSPDLDDRRRAFEAAVAAEGEPRRPAHPRRGRTAARCRRLAVAAPPRGVDSGRPRRAAGFVVAARTTS